MNTLLAVGKDKFYGLTDIVKQFLLGATLRDSFGNLLTLPAVKPRGIVAFYYDIVFGHITYIYIVFNILHSSMQNIHTCKYRKSISSGKINLCATKLSVSQTEDNERASLMGHPLVVVFFQPDGSNQPSSPSPPPGVGVVPPLPVPEPVAGFFFDGLS